MPMPMTSTRRPTPRERLDDGRAARGPGDLQRHCRLGAVVCRPQPHSATPLLERMLEYGEPYGSFDPEVLHHMHSYALGASILIGLTGIGLAFLYYCPPGFQYFVPTRLERGSHGPAVWRRLPVPGPEVVFRRAVRGRPGPAVPGLRPALPRDRPDPDRRPGQRRGGRDRVPEPDGGHLRHDRRGPPGQPDRQGRLCRG